MRNFIFSIAAVTLSNFALIAAPVDDAKKLYLAGDYPAAIEKLEALRKSSPRDGNINYYLGAALAADGQTARAIEPLETAEKRGVTDASRILAQIAFDNYDVDAADEYLDNWETKLKKNKKADTTPVEDMRTRLVMLRNMLERVEHIEIIDSVNVDAADFFTHYRLSPEAGRLLIPEDADINARTVVYIPQNNREMMWAEADTAGIARLISASILDDGTIDCPVVLNGEFSDGGDADYPFLMPDGMTLYYAATGDASLGGYDIFLTRRNEDGYLQPQNVGMPYNSIFNDYMLAIDEATGAGWFASDRNQIPGKVTIYTFIPSQSRNNYDPDDPALADLARITSIAASQKAGADYSAIRTRIASIDEGGSNRRRHANLFCIAMGNGSVYTSLDDFNNRQARKEMEAYLKAENQLVQMTEELDALRLRYAKGDRTVADQILDAETAIEFTRQNLVELRNKVIRLETK